MVLCERDEVVVFPWLWLVMVLEVELCLEVGLDETEEDEDEEEDEEVGKEEEEVRQPVAGTTVYVVEHPTPRHCWLHGNDV